MIRLFGYYVSRIYLVLGLIEAALFFAAFNLAVLVRFGWEVPTDLDACAGCATGLLFAAVMALSVMAMGLYQRGIHEAEAGFIVRLTFAFAIGAAMLALAFYIFPTLMMGRGIVMLALAFSFVGVVLLRESFSRIVGAQSQKRRILVLGAGVNAQRVEDLLAREQSLGFVVVGYVPLPHSHFLIPNGRLIRPEGTLLEAAISHDIDEIVLATDDRRRKLPVAELLDCRMSGIEILDLLTFFEKEMALVRIDLLHPSWIFLSQEGFRTGFRGLYGKRFFDLVVASMMLLLALPFMGVVAAAILIESRFREPLLYHQIRVGQDGVPFRLHKFRSMRPDAEADGLPRWAHENDQRITRVGRILRKTRLDELPQLFNILKGQMSLVGPRPERPEFVEQLAAMIPYYAERHRVKPGLTGWAQVLYTYGSDEEDAKRKLEFDLYYVKHAGVVLDLIVLMLTVEIVLLGKGAR